MLLLIAFIRVNAYKHKHHDYVSSALSLKKSSACHAIMYTEQEIIASIASYSAFLTWL